MSKKNNISDCSECFSEEVLLKYINDELGSEESAAIEKHILTCNICSDVVDGLLMLEPENSFSDLKTEIDREIDLKIHTLSKKRVLNTTMIRSIAAIALILVVSGTYILINNLLKKETVNNFKVVSEKTEQENQDLTKSSKNQEQIADVEEKEKEETKSGSAFRSVLEEPDSDFATTEKEDFSERNNSQCTDEKSTKAQKGNIITNGNVSDDDDVLSGVSIFDIVPEVIEKADRKTVSGESDYPGNIDNRSEDIAAVSGKESRFDLSVNQNRRNKKAGEGQISEKGKGAPAKTESNISSVSQSTTSVEVDELLIMADEEFVEETVNSIDKISFNAAIAEEESEECLNFVMVEEKPVFPGGDSALLSFILNNTRYPYETKENGIQGKVFVKFIIDKNGEVTNVTIARGVDPALDEEAVRVIKSLPKWIPGKQRGLPVNVSYIIPINFRVE